MARNSNVHIDINMVYIIIVALAIIVVIYMMTNKSHTSQRPIVVSAPQGNCQNMLDMCQSKLTNCNTKFGDSVERFQGTIAQGVSSLHKETISKRTDLGESSLRVLNPIEGRYGGLSKNKDNVYTANNPLDIYVENPIVKECTNLSTGKLIHDTSTSTIKPKNVTLIAKYNGPGLFYNCQYGKVQAVLDLLENGTKKGGKFTKNNTVENYEYKNHTVSDISNIYDFLFTNKKSIQVPPPKTGPLVNKNMTILQFFDTLITYTSIVPFYLLDKDDRIISIGDCGEEFPYSSKTIKGENVYDKEIKSIVFKFIDLKAMLPNIVAKPYLGSPFCYDQDTAKN